MRGGWGVGLGAMAGFMLLKGGEHPSRAPRQLNRVHMQQPNATALRPSSPAASAGRSTVTTARPVAAGGDSYQPPQLAPVPGFDPKLRPNASAAVPAGTGDGWMLLTTVSEPYVDMLMNWLAHWHLAGLGHVPVEVIAHDTYSFDYLSANAKLIPNLNVTGVSDDRKANTTMRAKYGGEGYGKVVTQRPVEILRRLEDDHSRNVVYADVDTVVMRDPFPFFVGEGIELWGQTDGSTTYKGRPGMCTGFMAFKNTATTRALMDRWRLAMEPKPGSMKGSLNQPAFNDRALGRKCPSYMRYLPRETFRRGKDGCGPADGTVAYFHANWVQGIPKKLSLLRTCSWWEPNYFGLPDHRTMK